MAAAHKYTKEEREIKMADFIERYKQSNGLLYQTCHDVHIKHDTIKKWREKYPDFDAAIRAVDEEVGDFVIGELMKKIKDGNTACIMFWLKCKKHWKETSKVEVTNGNEYDVEQAIEDLKNAVKN